MKKHFILTSLFASMLVVNAQTQTHASANLQTPGFRFEKSHGVTEQPSGVYTSRNYDHGRDNHCDCNKCKKSKKQGSCSHPGKHYGKHKHQNKHHNSCHTSRCEQDKNRDYNDRDRWSSGNQRDRRDDNKRPNTSTRRDRGSQYPGDSRSSQRRGGATRQVKTNRPGAARKVGSRPSAARL